MECTLQRLVLQQSFKAFLHGYNVFAEGVYQYLGVDHTMPVHFFSLSCFCNVQSLLSWRSHCLQRVAQRYRCSGTSYGCCEQQGLGWLLPGCLVGAGQRPRAVLLAPSLPQL